MIRLNCFARVEADKKEEVLKAARRLTEASIHQPGCVAYDIFESATRPDVLMICETWKDEDALKNHAESEAYKTESALIHANAEIKVEKFFFGVNSK